MTHLRTANRSSRFRRVGALLFALALLTPTTSAAERKPEFEDMSVFPVGLDLFLVRPIGMFAVAAGTLLMIPATPATLLVAPSKIGVVYDTLVTRPAEFLWIDPIGSHLGGLPEWMNR